MANVITPEVGYLEYNDPGTYDLNIAELGITTPVSITIQGAAGLGSLGSNPDVTGNGGGGAAYVAGMIPSLLEEALQISLPANGDQTAAYAMFPVATEGVVVNAGANGDEGTGGTLVSDSLGWLSTFFDGGSGAEGSLGDNFSGGGGGAATENGPGNAAVGNGGGLDGDTNASGEDGSASDPFAKGGGGGGQAKVILQWTPASGGSGSFVRASTRSPVRSPIRAAIKRKA